MDVITYPWKYMYIGHCNCKTVCEVDNKLYMMTLSNGNIVRVTGPLCGEFTGHRRIPLTKVSDAELWYFLWSAPEQTVE